MGVKFGMPVVLILLPLAVSCKDGNDEHKATRASTPPPAQIVKERPLAKKPSEPLVPQSFDQRGDEGAALARAGSRSAWSAVIARDQLLGRRGQLGVVHGLVLEGEQPGRFRLVDDIIGQGTLSIPVTFPESLYIEPPMRLVTWGAWQLREGPEGQADEWIWKVTRAERLEDEPGPPYSPGMFAREKSSPGDLVPASKASRRGASIRFTVLASPVEVGDGWLIADDSKAEAAARLFLPGEVESYGSQSRPSSSERWQLQAGQPYWLEIGRFRPVRGGALPVYQARTVPFTLPNAP